MEEKKKNLRNIYDVINKIARKHKEQGHNIDDWFYTKEDIIHMKKDNRKKFLT